MKKIISLFQRNYDGDRRVRDEITPGAEWVVAGEGEPTRKWDGTSCMVRDGQLYKRYDAKRGKTPPNGFEPAQEPDPVTGHYPGWVPIGEGPEDRYHRDAYDSYVAAWGFKPTDGTYELIGPKVQGNPEGCDIHILLEHGDHGLIDVPTDFDGLRDYLERTDIEGIVWYHPDGRMVKLKARDLGIKRGATVINQVQA